jgi:hypothetical protein
MTPGVPRHLKTRSAASRRACGSFLARSSLSERASTAISDFPEHILWIVRILNLVKLRFGWWLVAEICDKPVYDSEIFDE